MRKTHAAAGLALGLGLSLIHHQPVLNAALLWLLTQAAALLPDLDLKLHIKHRTITHSLLALLLVSLATWYVDPRLLVYVASGYGSHLVLDFLTVWGIPIFWPVKRRFRLLRISTGGEVDHVICVLLVLAASYLVMSIVYPNWLQDGIAMFQPQWTVSRIRARRITMAFVSEIPASAF